MPVLGRQGSTQDLAKKDILGVLNKENQRKGLRDGLVTERGRAGTLSPANPDNDRKIGGGMHADGAKSARTLVVWREKEEPYI